MKERLENVFELNIWAILYPRSKLSNNHELELEFKAHGDQWDRETMEKYSKKLKVTERDIQVWIRYQKVLSRPSKLDKFVETGWRWVFYTSIFTSSLWVLSGKTWFWNILDCWVDFPHHQMDNDVWWIYMLELSFYWCLFFTQVRYSMNKKGHSQIIRCLFGKACILRFHEKLLRPKTK